MLAVREDVPSGPAVRANGDIDALRAVNPGWNIWTVRCWWRGSLALRWCARQHGADLGDVIYAWEPGHLQEYISDHQQEHCAACRAGAA